MELHIRVSEAADVPKMDVGGKSDPYVVIHCSGTSQKWKTKIVKNSLTPVWNEEFHLPISTNGTETIKFEMYDQDSMSSDDLIATLEINAKTLQEGKVVDNWYQMTSAKGVKGTARIRLVLHLAKSGRPAFVA